MKSNYKRLGDYIRPCDEKNSGNVIKKLQGISNQKYFQKAKTNTIGVDLKKYRIVRNGQFAFNRATTRNGEKISIALRQGKDCIVSPSYRIFESKDEKVLNSEYLMMWFKRPEFDRYARFKSHGSAHEFFDYDEMCEVMLPIPAIEKQQQLVDEYNTIQNRIALNNQLITRLEETAQAIYKQWFVDFEFPFVTSNGVEMPYKSSGGKMVWCEELEKEIPDGWSVSKIGNEYELTIGRTPPRIEKKWFNKNEHSINWISIKDLASCQTYIFDTNENLTLEAIKEFSIPIIKENTTIMSFKMSIGKLAITTKDMLSNEAIVHFNISDDTKFSSEFIYCFLKDFQFNKLGTTSSIVDSINTQIIKNIDLLIPEKLILNQFNKIIYPLFKNKKYVELENQKLEELKELLLAKMTRID